MTTTACDDQDLYDRQDALGDAWAGERLAVIDEMARVVSPNEWRGGGHMRYAGHVITWGEYVSRRYEIEEEEQEFTIEPWPEDPAAHYRYTLRARITDEDIARGYTEVKLDPYRVCDVYDTGGGPREQMVKKLLRWTDKGQSEEKVLDEIESALKRWREMRREDAL